MSLTPLSLFQRDIYFDQLLYPGEPIYNIGAKVVIDGPISVPKFERAYQEFVDQHDVLRYRLCTVNGQPYFTKSEPETLSLPLIDFSSENNASEKISAFIARDFAMPFSFDGSKPLFCFILLKERADRFVLYSRYHHILVDGWATSLLFQRLVKYYNDLVRYDEIRTHEVFSFERYLESDAAYSQSQEYIDDRNYWSKKFAGAPEPLLRPVETKPVIASGRRVLKVQRSKFDALSRVAGVCGVTEFHMILGTLAFVLLKMQRTSECVASLPVLNRTTAYFKKTVGLFMGVSPLRIPADFNVSFAEYVRRIKDDLRKDYRHQKFPLSHLIQSANLPRERSGIFDFSLSFEKHGYDPDFLGTKTFVSPLSHFAERLPLSIYVREFDRAEDVMIDFDHNYGYFDNRQAQAFVSYFETALDNIVTAPRSLLCDLDFVPPEIKDKVIREYNRTDFTFGETLTVCQVVDHWSATTPEKIAILDDANAYTYLEVKNFTDRFAFKLQELTSANGNQVVAVLMDRSATTIMVLLGILKAGYAYLPLDPAFPPERLKYIVENSGCGVLVTDQPESDFVKSVPCKVLALEGVTAAKCKADDLVRFEPRLDGKAYIIYTSGSTGHPKGVVVSHRSLMNFLRSMTIAPGIGRNDLLLSVTTYSFDISILEFFLPLINGARVFVCSSADVRDAGRIKDKIGRVKPTIMQATPAFYQMLVNSKWTPENMKILCGGDLLHKALADKLIESAAEVWNMYGPTETTIWSTGKKMETGDDCHNIGRPIHNTRVYILDDHGAPLPPGAIGRIFISGKGVALGYHNNADLTSERFLPNSFCEGEVMYDTGDLGMWTHDGEVIFYGRSDNQVKIRGYRIELSEIELALSEVTGQEEVAVVAKKGGEGDSMLLAFIRGDHSVDTRAIRESLKTKLPGYMIPDVIRIVDSFPLTPNNKIDRKKIAESFTEEIQISGEQTRLTDKEMVMMTLWEKVLGKQSLDSRRSFFELGGHSIKANQLVDLINATFRTSISLKEFFDNPFISDLTRITERCSESVGKITPAARKESYDVSPSQMNLLDGCRMDEVSASYNMYSLFAIRGNFNPEGFRRALQSVMDQNAILRTNFIWTNDIPQQVIRPAEEDPRIFLHVSARNFEHVVEIAEHHAFMPMGLGADPLLRCFYIVTDDGEKYLFFITHHLIMDGISFDHLVRALANGYNAIPTQQDSSIQYHDYCEWINEHLRRDNGHAAETYWQKLLSGWKPAELFHRSVPRQSFTGQEIGWMIDGDLYLNLQETATTLNVSLYSLLLASLSNVVFITSQANDFCIGVPFSARIHPEVSRKIGMFTNTTIFRQQIEKGISFGMMAQATQRQLSDTAAHQHYPLYKIISSTNLPAAPFEITVSYLKTDEDHARIRGFDGFELESVALKNTMSRMPVVISINDVPGKLSVVMTFDKQMYDDEMMEIFMHRFHQHLTQLTPSAVHREVSSFDLRVEAEKRMASGVVDIAFNL